jgi:hypothetical protein
VKHNLSPEVGCFDFTAFFWILQEKLRPVNGQDGSDLGDFERQKP